MSDAPAPRRARRASRSTALLVAAALSACGGAADPDATGDLRGPGAPRNLVLVSLDTLRPDRLGAYGHDRDTSPALDALAADGVVFEDASATSPWTLPSHASLLTGLYPNRHRLRGHADALPAGARTAAEVLGEAGFETLGVVSSPLLGPDYGLDRGFDRLRVVSPLGETIAGYRRVENRAREVTDAALELLDARGAAPFFLFVHYYDAHTDYAPDADVAARFVDTPAGVLDGRIETLLAVRRGELRPGEADVAHVLQLYDAEVRQLDDQLARLFTRLAEAGLADDTLVVVTSDHGEEFLEHGSVLHSRTYFQEVVRVPLILRGPGVARGRRAPGLVSLVDVLPTACALLGVAPPPGLPGRDLLAPADPDRVVFAEGDYLNERPNTYRMARRGPHKLIRNAYSGSERLVDLDWDPAERRDSALRAPAAADRLRAELDAYAARAAADAAAGDAPDDSESDARIEQLRQLGYVR